MHHYQLAAEVKNDGSVSEFVFATSVNSADYMKQGTSHYRLIHDHLGSPCLVVNSLDGTIMQRLDYNEWGNVIADSNPNFQPFAFAGGLYDSDTNLTKFGARDYAASIARWNSKDPILFAGGDTNLYRYVIGDPINYFDPNGESSKKIIIGSVSLIIGVGAIAFSGGIAAIPIVASLGINAGAISTFGAISAVFGASTLGDIFAKNLFDVILPAANGSESPPEVKDANVPRGDVDYEFTNKTEGRFCGGG